MQAARVEQLAIPTLGADETLASLAADDFDPEAAGKRSMGYARLDQLAIEHILGAR